MSEIMDLSKKQNVNKNLIYAKREILEHSDDEEYIDNIFEDFFKKEKDKHCLLELVLLINKTCNKSRSLKYEYLIDLYYSHEMSLCEGVKNEFTRTLGFKYIYGEYGGYPLCLEFFCNKFLDNILFKDADEDLEEILHKNFDSYEDFESSKPNRFIIELVEAKDIDLAYFLKMHIGYINGINNYLQIIKTNWPNYDITSEEEMFNKMLAKVNRYYDKNYLSCSFSNVEILVYLANKNHVLGLFDKYYRFEDENIYEIARECNLSDVPKTKDDLYIIENMDRIMKKTLHLKADIVKLGD